MASKTVGGCVYIFRDVAYKVGKQNKITSSTFDGCTSDTGGAIYTDGVSLDISGSTFINN